MKTIARWQQSLLKSIQLQLFMSFISLPFLISWGLPISLMSPVSTLLFGPFLTCFLLISSLIFFCELLYIPNGALIYCLEWVTTIWQACLQYEQKSWLIGIAKPPMIILCIIPLIALALLHYKKITSLATRTLLLLLLLIATCTILKLFPYAYNSIETIPCNNKTITLINNHQQGCTFLIDPGALAARPSYESFIAYTLLPAIIQKTGLLQIDHLITFKLNKRTLDALTFLATKVTVKNIYLPAWQGKIPLFAWRSYAKLKKTIIAQGGKLISLSYKKQLCNDQMCNVAIVPQDTTKTIRYYDATYAQLRITGTIDNQQIAI
jgi:hypothetical protein